MKIEHIALNVEEPVLMARWYVEHLGLTVKRRMVDSPFAHFLAGDDDRVMLEIYGNKNATVPDYRNADPAIFHIAFWSDNVETDCRRLQSAGAQVVADAHQINDDTFAMLRDPWGIPLQLVKRGTKMI